MREWFIGLRCHPQFTIPCPRLGNFLFFILFFPYQNVFPGRRAKIVILPTFPAGKSARGASLCLEAFLVNLRTNFVGKRFFSGAKSLATLLNLRFNHGLTLVIVMETKLKS